MLSVPALNSDDAKKCPLCHAGEWIFLFPFLLGFMLTLGFSRVWSLHFIVLQTVVNSSSAWNCLDLFSGQVNSPWPTSEPKYIPRRFPHRRSDPKTEWHCNGFKVSAQYNGVPVGVGKATKPSFWFQSWVLYWGNSQQIFFIHQSIIFIEQCQQLHSWCLWSEVRPVLASYVCVCLALTHMRGIWCAGFKQLLRWSAFMLSLLFYLRKNGTCVGDCLAWRQNELILHHEVKTPLSRLGTKMEWTNEFILDDKSFFKRRQPYV